LTIQAALALDEGNYMTIFSRMADFDAKMEQLEERFLFLEDRVIDTEERIDTLERGVRAVNEAIITMEDAISDLEAQADHAVGNSDQESSSLQEVLVSSLEDLKVEIKRTLDDIQKDLRILKRDIV